MKHKFISRILTIVLSVVAVSGLASCGTKKIEYIDDQSVRLNLDYKGKDFYKDGVAEVTLKTCIDGDTAHFSPLAGSSNMDTIKSRFFGIDTPESTGKVEPYGKAASNFTKEKLKTASEKGTIVVSSAQDYYGKPNPDSTGERYVTLIWVCLDKKNADVEDLRLLNLWLVQEGYSYVYGDDIHRKLEDIILVDDLRSYICKKYSTANLTTTEIKTIISRVVDVGTSTSLYAKNKEAYYLVTEGFDLAREDISQVGLHVDFIDFDNPENNVFKVVNQYSVKGLSIRRPDLLVFINGIPVCIFEFKTAIKEDTTIHDAWKQVTVRYARDIENLMKYCFLAVISDGANNRLGSIFTPYEFFYSWNKANDSEKVSNGISSLLTLIKGAFSKERVLAILRDFVYYPEIEGKEQEIVCRYPQFFAANHMVENVKKHLKPHGDGKGGTYFGATGCGKTQCCS